MKGIRDLKFSVPNSRSTNCSDPLAIKEQVYVTTHLEFYENLAEYTNNVYDFAFDEGELAGNSGQLCVLLRRWARIRISSKKNTLKYGRMVGQLFSMTLSRKFRLFSAHLHHANVAQLLCCLWYH